jgi:MscS family membrane protein
VLTLAASAAAATAQEEPAAEATDEAKEPAGPADEYDRGTPRSAMQGYLLACREGDYERAAEYLDLRPLDAEGRKTEAELARQLKIVLDKELWVEIESLSQHPRGQSGDGLPSYRDRVGTIRSGEGPVEVFLQRVPRGDSAFV